MEKSEKPAFEVPRELRIRLNQLYKWKEQLSKRGTGALPGSGHDQLNDELTRLRQELEQSKKSETS